MAFIRVSQNHPNAYVRMRMSSNVHVLRPSDKVSLDVRQSGRNEPICLFINSQKECFSVAATSSCSGPKYENDYSAGNDMSSHYPLRGDWMCASSMQSRC